MATIARSILGAILALWVAGLGVGAIYLTLGVELLAVLQWVLSTLVAISFVFFSFMFGEYGPDNSPQPVEGRHLLKIGLIALLGAGFAWVISFGAAHLPHVDLKTVLEGADVAAIGANLTNRHILSLEVLALTFFLVLVGSGVIARPDPFDAPSDQEDARR